MFQCVWGVGWSLTDTSSVACGRQLIAHRTSRSGCSGVPHGLFSRNSPPDCFFRNAHASGLRPSISALCFPFGKARCSGRLIFRKQSTGLFSPKRLTFRASPLRRRTETVLRPVPVFRSAYFPETVHRTVSSKTLDLQGFAPPGEPSRGSRGLHAVVFCVVFRQSEATTKGPHSLPQKDWWKYAGCVSVRLGRGLELDGHLISRLRAPASPQGEAEGFSAWLFGSLTQPQRG